MSPSGASVDPATVVDELTLSELYDDAPCAYLSVLVDGTIVRANDTFLRWTGRMRDDVVARMRLTELLSVGSRIYFETHCAPLLAVSGEVREIALDLRCEGGQPLPVLVGARRLPATADRPEILRVTMFDASQRRGYERELQASLSTERAARERIEALQRITLRLASLSKASEVESAVIGELVGGGMVERATIVRSRGTDQLSDATFRRASPERVTGDLPLITPTSTTVGTLSVELPAEPSMDEEAFLQATAEITARALDRIRRADAASRKRAAVSDLPTQRWWTEALGAELRHALLSRRHVTLAAVRLPELERYAQAYGADAADAQLLALLNLWRDAGYDLLSPWGTEEFVALMPGLSREGAAQAVASLRAVGLLSTPFSVGLAQWDRLEDGYALLERAEAQLARAEASARR